jgi:hypothetical protein
MVEEKQVEKRTYKLNFPVLYKKKRYDRGTIDMEPEFGDPLVEQGVLANPGEDEDEDVLSRDEKIRMAILQLDREDTELWTTEGKPKTEVLGLIDGTPVRAGERNDAWAKINESEQ